MKSTEATALSVGHRGRSVVVTAGSFGERVGQLWCSSRKNALAVPASLTDDCLGTLVPELLILALWRPWHEMCRWIERACGEQRVAWLPAVNEYPFIRVGPMVIPGRPPCYSCYAARRVQHDRAPEASRALSRAYDEDPALGPVGFLPHQARLAVALCGLLTTAWLEGSRTGDVLTADVRSGTIHRSAVIACHGCHRCRPRTVHPPAELRSILSDALGWQPDAATLGEVTR